MVMLTNKKIKWILPVEYEKYLPSILTLDGTISCWGRDAIPILLWEGENSILTGIVSYRIVG